MRPIITLLLVLGEAAAKTRNLIVVAGAGKCGTNALAYHVSALVGFRPSRRDKQAQVKLNGFAGEVNYPNCSFGGGVRPAYEQLLQRSKSRPGAGLDKSANYLGMPGCAAKLRRAYPAARVVASICSAASRLWSRMNHVNRDRKSDDASDRSKSVDWPAHVVDVARAQLAKLDARGWSLDSCRTGPATHVCKVLVTSRWHRQVSSFRDAFGAGFAVFLMEELLTLEGFEIRSRLATFLGAPPPTREGTAKHKVVHSNAAHKNYKKEKGHPRFAELAALLEPVYANDTRRLAALLPDAPVDLWRRSVRPGKAS